MKTLTLQNKTQKIASLLRKRIQSGKYAVGEKLPSAVAMAEEFGVTKETVNMAVSHLVSENIVYRKQGSGTYVSDFKKQRTKLLGVLLPGECAGEFFSAILTGIDEVSSALGYHQIVKFSGHSRERERNCLEELLETRVDGIILCFNHPEHSRGNVEFLMERGIPFVLIDRYFPELRTDYVGFDNFAAGRMAVNYCMEHGHKNIAFVSILPIDYSSVATRLNGYYAASEDGGCNGKAYVVECPQDGNLEAAIETLLAGENPPTAIVTNRLDEVIKVAARRKLEIPRDISIIKFGWVSDPFGFFAYIDTPVREMARKATEILVDRIAAETYSAGCMIELEPKLVTGNSVAVPGRGSPRDVDLVNV